MSRNYQSFSCFRYLGRQRSDPYDCVIAFAQRTGAGSAAGTFQIEGKPAEPIFYQGLAWMDPQTNQVVRMPTDLLAPRTDIVLEKQSTEIWFCEVHFKGVSHALWLPREVVDTTKWIGDSCRRIIINTPTIRCPLWRVTRRSTCRKLRRFAS